MNLISNFFPITFISPLPSESTFRSFTIRRVRYSEEYLKKLRNEHNTTHSFFRNGDHIYISHMEGNLLQVGETTKLDVQTNASIVLSLIRHIFFRTFHQSFPGIIPLSFYPFQILSRKEDDDLIHGQLPNNLKGALSLKKLIEVQFRSVQIQGETQFGAVINIRYQWLFSKNCKDLLEEGFDIQGLNVLTSEPLPGLNGILAPDESLIGPIVNINGDNAWVETNDGQEVHKLEELYLHKSVRNIRDYLEFRLGEDKTNQIFNSISDKDQTRRNAKYYFSEQYLRQLLAGCRLKS